MRIIITIIITIIIIKLHTAPYCFSHYTHTHTASEWVARTDVPDEVLPLALMQPRLQLFSPVHFLDELGEKEMSESPWAHGY